MEFVEPHVTFEEMSVEYLLKTMLSGRMVACYDVLKCLLLL